MHIGMALALALFLVACSPSADQAEDDGRLRVVTTTGMLADVVREVGKDRVDVEALMGPGVDPHLYKPTAGDLDRLLSADLVIMNGLHLEGRMDEALAQLDEFGVRVVEAAEAVPVALREEVEADTYDPHVWFDPGLWAYVVQDVGDVLAELDAEGADEFEANVEFYLGELGRLDSLAEQEFATIPEASRVLITAHDAFHYLGAAYEIEVLGIQGISTETEASASDIRELADLIVERNVKAVFIETSVNPATVEALVESVEGRGGSVAIGGEIFSDALGDPESGADTYVAMFEHNVRTIAQGLR